MQTRTISFKAVYPKHYIKEMRNLAEKEKRARIQSARENVQYLKNGLAEKRFDKAWEHLALARLLRESHLKTILEKEIAL